MTDEIGAPTDNPAADPAPPADQPWWHGRMPDEIAALDDVQNSKDEASFWDQYKNMRSRMGNSLSIPGEDASGEVRQKFLDKIRQKVPDLILRPGDDPESQQAFYSMIGRPESADKYKMPDLDIPEGVSMSDDIGKNAAAIAHKYGLTQKQFEGVIGEMLGAEIQSAAAGVAQQKEGMTKLANEWGYAFDVNSKRAVMAAEKTGAPESLIEMMNDGTASAEMVRYFHGLAKVIGSEPNEITSGNKHGNAIDPLTAEEKISEIMNNKNHAFWNPADPAHESAKARMSELYRLKNPGNQVVSIVGSS